MVERTSLWLFGLASLAACSTIVGADFDDRNEGTSSMGGNTMGGSAAGGQKSSGGTATGGAPSSGGAPLSGGAGVGGSVAAGGVASGGTAGAPSGAGTSGGPIASGGNSGGNGGDHGGATTAGDGGQASGAGGEAQAGAGGEPGGGGAAGAGGSGGEGGGASGPPIVVLNEIRGQGEGSDFIEIFNRGPGTLALEGYGLSDENNTFVFPSGASIPEGGYVLLLLKQTDLNGVLYRCYTPNPCYHAGWAVSKDAGEMVYLRGRLNQVLDSTHYPASGSTEGIADTQTWSRFPNGTGMFQAASPTPERANDVL